MNKTMEIPARKSVAKIRADYLLVSVQNFKSRSVECVEHRILVFVHIILLLLLLTANGFSPGGSGTTIR
jgi:hypothetical protein